MEDKMLYVIVGLAIASLLAALVARIIRLRLSAPPKLTAAAIARLKTIELPEVTFKNKIEDDTHGPSQNGGKAAYP